MPIQANSSPQILDLTRPGASLVAPANSAAAAAAVFNVPTSVLPAVSGATGQTLSKNANSDGNNTTSKREQTEPMDFSSGQAMTFATNRSFETSSFNRGASPGDLSRFRSTGNHYNSSTFHIPHSHHY